jgi:hypothetical protein
MMFLAATAHIIHFSSSHGLFFVTMTTTTNSFEALPQLMIAIYTVIFLLAPIVSS